jgi:hypothetical protein
MADMPVMRARTVSRANLATFLKNPELIKAFEALVSDVVTALPDAVNTFADVANDAYASALLAMGAAAAARAETARLGQVLAQVETVLMLQRDRGAEIALLRQRFDALEVLIQTLQHPNLDTLRAQIEELKSIVLGA